MPFVFSHTEYCDMHFAYVFFDGNASAAVDDITGPKISFSHNRYSQQCQSAWTQQWLDQIIIPLRMHDLSTL